MSVLFSCLYGDLEPKRRIILRRKAVIDGVTVIIQLDAVAVAVRCAVLEVYEVVKLSLPSSFSQCTLSEN